MIENLQQRSRWRVFTTPSKNNSSYYPTMNKKESNKAGVPCLPELLAPAGNFEKLVTAIHYGADAVYMGGKEFSLRAKAGNFTHQAMTEAVQYAHQHGVKVYVTINILAHNRDFAGLDSYLLQLQEAAVDGLIIADPGIFLRARKCVPHIPIHLSTQANVTNAQAARFWFEQGAENLTERAYEKARYIIENHKQKPLPEAAAATMRTITAEYEAELGVSQS